MMSVQPERKANVDQNDDATVNTRGHLLHFSSRFFNRFLDFFSQFHFLKKLLKLFSLNK